MAVVGEKLGWRWPRPNDFTGPDSRPLRDTFLDLQRFMTWPHAWLMAAHPSAPSTHFGLVPAANVIDWSYANLDPYGIFVPGEGLVVPQDSRTWILQGAYNMGFSGITNPLIVQTNLRVNGVGTAWWGNTLVPAGFGVAFTSSPFHEIVHAGDVISIRAVNTIADAAMVCDSCMISFHLQPAV